MDDIIAHARELGKKIADHPRTAEFLSAAKAVSEDSDAQALLTAYQAQGNRLRELEAAGKPIEVDDKHKLADCETKVAGNEKLKLMMKHQADYLEMMNRVNHAIDETIQAKQGA